jgi:hypothetical protein
MPYGSAKVDYLRCKRFKKTSAPWHCIQKQRVCSLDSKMGVLPCGIFYKINSYKYKNNTLKMLIV